MRTILRILAIPALLVCGSVALAQPPATNLPATESKSPGAKSSGTTTTGSSSNTTGSGGSSQSSGTTGASGASSSSFFGTAAKKPDPGSLEEMLDSALRNNPEIRAAEAKVRDAEVESNRVRNQIIAKVVQLRNDIELSKKMLAHVQEIEKLENHVRDNHGSRENLLAALMATAKVDTQKAEIAKLEADLKAMLGSYGRMKSGADASNSIGSNSTGATGTWTVSGKTYWVDPLQYDLGRYSATNAANPGTVQPPMAERIKIALEKPIQLGEIKEASLTDVVNVLTKKVDGGITFRAVANNAKISLEKGEMPLGAWLQMVEDSIDGLRFVVRDYGILATSAASVPEGALTVQQFWKQQEKAKPPTPKAVPGSPPIIPPK
jgi:hypothetical protein